VLQDPWSSGGSGNWIRSGASEAYVAYGKTTPVRTGYSLDDYIGRVVVVHEGEDKVACGVIQPSIALKTSLSLSGMQANAAFDYHIHEGGSCMSTATAAVNDVVKGHWYDTTLLSVDPWWGGGKYDSDSAGTLSISDTLSTGYDLLNGAGYDPLKLRTLVFHDSTGARAGCAVFSAEGDVGGADIDGRITFRQSTSAASEATHVSYHFTGLKPGPHNLHVHKYGDVSSGDVDFVGGHYVGDGNAVRPGLTDIKVAYLQNGIPIVANDRGVAIGAFNDATPGLLDGDNSIMGRSIVLHSPVDGTKIAQGVLGLSGKYVTSGAFVKSDGTTNGVVDRATRFYNGGDGTGSKYAATSKVPFVSSGVCVLKRDGRSPTVDATTKESTLDTDLQGIVRFETTMDVKELPKTADGTIERKEKGMPTVNVEWSISGMKKDASYNWEIRELGDLTSSAITTEGKTFVGAGTHRNAARATLVDLNNAEIIYGDVLVHTPATAIFATDTTKYPGYVGATPQPKGYVSVTQAYDPTHGAATSPTLKVTYRLEGFSSKAVGGGLHVHVGTTCAEAGGHYWNAEAVYSDPWFTKWGLADDAGMAEGSFTLRIGYSMDQMVGRTIVLHDSEGKRMSCAVLSSDSTAKMAPLHMEYATYGLEASATGGLHIHSGTSCTDTSSQGGHLYDTSLYTSDDEPWKVTKYSTDSAGRSAGEFHVVAGISMSEIAPNTVTLGSNKVVVLHAADGSRKACGVLVSPAQGGTVKSSANPSSDKANGGPICGTSAQCLSAGILGNTGSLSAPTSSGSISGYSSGAISDPFVSLNGPNSVLGRSLVIMENGDPVASCVIGRGYTKLPLDFFGTTSDIVGAPSADGATCLMYPTSMEAPPLAVASVGAYPAYTPNSGADPVGEVRVTETAQMSASSFVKYVGYAGTAVVNTDSKVWVSQMNKDKVRVSYTMKMTGVPNGNYGVHVHVGTSCDVAAGAHMWQPATSPDPWATSNAKYKIVTNVANGYFDIDMGYSLFSTQGRVIVVHDGADKIACSVLASESAIAMEYDMQNLESNSKGGMHLHTGTSCAERNAVGGHYYDTSMYTDTVIEPWTATFWSSDMGGRAYGTIVVNNGYSMQQNIGHVVVLHDSEGVRIGCGKVLWSRNPLRTTDQGGANMGEGISGHVHFENTAATGDKTKVQWHLSGLSSDAPYHSWHIHDFGDLSGGNDNGYFAGEHFVGTGVSAAQGSQVAFIGNAGAAGSHIVSDRRGHSEGTTMDDDITLFGMNSIIGRSVVIHGVRMNGRGTWWTTKAGSCVVGRAMPETHVQSDRGDGGGVYLAYLRAYPGYVGPLKSTVSGVVTVGQIDEDTTVLHYELSGLEIISGSQGGLHIHQGTTCEEAGGHYWDKSSLPDDPWTPMKHNPSTLQRTASGAMSIITGINLRSNAGRTVVLHDSKGTRIACGVLGSKASSVAELAQDAAGGGSCTGSYFGVVGAYPRPVAATAATDASGEYVSGIVSVSMYPMDASKLELYYDLSSLVVSAQIDMEEKRLVVGESGTITINEGSSCDTDATVGEPFYNKDLYPTGVNSTYETVAKKVIDGREFAVTNGTIIMGTGYGMSEIGQKTIVVYSSSGLRIGCGVLGSKASDSSLAALSALVRQGAAAKYNKANMIDTPMEILTLSLSLAGAVVISLLLGCCIGRSMAGGGGGSGKKGSTMSSPWGSGSNKDDGIRRKSSRKLVDVEVRYYCDLQLPVMFVSCNIDIFFVEFE
jgi:Cu/Zn superoxide dismutase